MKEILKSGVTGILVSHSIGQVRSMSDKILWLEKGKQICFSGEVKKICDAYEEFLITKKAPQGPEEIDRMAKDYLERKAKEKAEKERSEQEKLLELLKNADQNAAREAAQKYLQISGGTAS